MSTARPSEEFHALTPADAGVLAALQAALAPLKGTISGPTARELYDTVMGQIPPAADVRFEAATVGGVPGWWCRPVHPGAADAALLYLHGGAYVVGSAQAYRHLVSQLVVRCGIEAFVPEYRLAPEHPFPAALDDAVAAYRGLAELGKQRLAICGDSAGGGLALATLALTTQAAATEPLPAPRTGVAFSPWTDLALTSGSLTTAAAADIILTRDALHADAQRYAQGHDAHDPHLSPVYGALVGLPPVQLHAGNAEILLDDAVRYARRAQAAGVAAELHVWEGMPHVFVSNVGQLRAAAQSLDLAGAFLAERLGA